MEYICLCIAKRMPFNVHLTIGIKRYCQHDAFLPIRVKGRDIGEPQWGKLEILENGKWKEYIPDQ